MIPALGFLFTGGKLWKVLKPLGIFAGVAIALWWAQRAVTNHFEEQWQVRETLLLQRIEIEQAKFRERERDAQKQTILRLEKRAEAKVAAARAKVQALKDTLKDERLARLGAAKPGLISKLATKASNEKLTEISILSTRFNDPRRMPVDDETRED